MTDSQEMLNVLDEEIIARFKQAIELGKWPDGRLLSDEQKEVCIKAIIVFEHNNLPEDQRTGYVPPKPTPCAPKDDVDEIKWQ